jgi:hypothetical protein
MSRQRKTYSLSALWGGEGWGEVGALLKLTLSKHTSPSRRCATGPSLSPLRAERGK